MLDSEATIGGAGADLEALARWFLEAAPSMEAEERGLGEELHRLLLAGEPVPPERLAAEAGQPAEMVRDFLERWTLLDEHRRVFAFLGLTLRPTDHRLTVKGRTLFAWCAWDALFLPELLGAAVDVESVCPQTGSAIRLSLTPSRVESVVPAETVVSFITPSTLSCSDESRCGGPTAATERSIAEFCGFIHFFASREAGERWTAERPGTFLLSLDAAFDLGRRTNRALFGDPTR